MSLKSSALALLGGASVVAYLAYEYKEKLQLNKKFDTALAGILSSEVETQISEIETLVGFLLNNKPMIRDLCARTDVLGELPPLIFSENEVAQLVTVELLAVISQDEQALDTIRHNNLFQPLVAILSFPFASDDLIEGTLLAIKNCLTPVQKPVITPSKLQTLKTPSDPIRRPGPGTDNQEREENWFARELQQLNGLEPLVNKLLSEDHEIQSLVLEIIINYCTLFKDQDDLGELGGIGFMLEIFTSKTSPPSLQSLALAALQHCVQSSSANIEQLRSAGGIKTIVSYLKNEAPKQLGSETEDVFNAIKILNVTLDTSGIECIRTEQIIPQIVQYFVEESNQDIKEITVTLLKQLAQNDPKCRREISDTFKRKNGLGNAGVPPSG